MPDIAQKATLDLKEKKLFVDGVEFPWLISEEGPKLNNLAADATMRSVTLTFFVDDVEVLPEERDETAD